MAFKPVRRVFSHTEKIQAPPEYIFNLFCPVRNYEWIPDWDCSLIHSKTGFAEQGCVFKTFDPYEGEDLWIIYDYKPYSLITFNRTDSFRTMKYQIQIIGGKGSTSETMWTQEIIALNNDGNRHVADLEKSDFVEMVQTLKQLLTDYIHSFS